MADDLAAGRQSATQLVEDCLTRIADERGEGKRAFLKVHRDAALALANNADRLRSAGAPLPRFAGIPISVKDLFDIAGDVTTAGSRVLADATPAQQDCPPVQRLRAAGFIVVGRTNMTEFAYSGLGLNPHYGTPLNAWQREAGRVPGGSSSGAAVSITDGMTMAALGTDTGGSCRIPAAFCGIVGWKPTASRVPLDGAVPLSFSLDSVGCLAGAVDDCAIIDNIIAGAWPDVPIDTVALSRLTLAVPEQVVLDNIDKDVGACFARALSILSRQGITVETISLLEIAEIATMSAKGGFPAAEAYAWHRDLLAEHGDGYDQRVRVRIQRGSGQDAADYINLVKARADATSRLRRKIVGIDALVMPTAPIVAPLISELERDEDFAVQNILALRNPTIANFFDMCSISLPIHEPSAAPVGLMLIGDHKTDKQLLQVGKTIEGLFRGG
jgi:aspartyl-tRNA(Asn)/glutamyl-tRNA(Gln) amidotransferase subunit A